MATWSYKTVSKEEFQRLVKAGYTLRGRVTYGQFGTVQYYLQLQSPAQTGARGKYEIIGVREGEGITVSEYERLRSEVTPEQRQAFIREAERIEQKRKDDPYKRTYTEEPPEPSISKREESDFGVQGFRSQISRGMPSGGVYYKRDEDTGEAYYQPATPIKTFQGKPVLGYGSVAPTMIVLPEDKQITPVQRQVFYDFSQQQPRLFKPSREQQVFQQLYEVKPFKPTMAEFLTGKAGKEGLRGKEALRRAVLPTGIQFVSKEEQRRGVKIDKDFVMIGDAPPMKQTLPLQPKSGRTIRLQFKQRRLAEIERAKKAGVGAGMEGRVDIAKFQPTEEELFAEWGAMQREGGKLTFAGYDVVKGVGYVMPVTHGLAKYYVFTQLGSPLFKTASKVIQEALPVIGKPVEWSLGVGFTAYGGVTTYSARKSGRIGTSEAISEYTFWGMPVIQMASPIRYVEFKTPVKGGGVQTRYRGLAVEYKTYGQPLIGIGDYTPKVGGIARIGTPKIDLKTVDLKTGFRTQTPAQTKILQESLPSIVSAKEVAKFGKVLAVTKGTYAESTPIDIREFPKRTVTLGEKGTKTVLEFAKGQKAYLYGSFGTEPQLPKGAIGKGRGKVYEVKMGEPTIVDIDIALTTTSERIAVQETKALMKQLRMAGEAVRINPKTPTLIEAKVKGKWRHAVDVHYSGMQNQMEALASGMSETGKSFGFPRGQQAPETIEGVKTERLGEAGVGKAESLLTVREVKGRKVVSPAEHRVKKDIADWFTIQKTLIEAKTGRAKAKLKIEFAEAQKLYGRGAKAPKVSKMKLYEPPKPSAPSKAIKTATISGMGVIGKRPSPSRVPRASKPPSMKMKSYISPSQKPSPSRYPSPSPYSYPSPSPSRYTSPVPSPSPYPSPSQYNYPSPSPSPSPSPYSYPSPSPYGYPSPSPSPSPTPPIQITTVKIPRGFALDEGRAKPSKGRRIKARYTPSIAGTFMKPITKAPKGAMVGIAPRPFIKRGKK